MVHGLRRRALASVALILGAGWAASATALSYSAQDLTTYYKWDKNRRLIMKIGPDPDGSNLRPGNQPSALRVVEQYTYDDDGLLVQTDVGTASSVSIDANGVVTANGFTISSTTKFKHDAIGNRTQIYANVGTSAASLAETSYDAAGRPTCTAVRMDPTAFSTLYAATDRPDACAPPPSGAANPDRVTRTVYDAAGQVKETIQALGTNAERTYAKYTYTPSGKQKTIIDANGNKTTLAYDGFDRLQQQSFPSVTRCEASSNPCEGLSNPNDYEQYDYDDNGNRKGLRKRDGNWITYEFDALNRMTRKSGARVATVDYRYDLTGKVKAATFGLAEDSDGVYYDYDTAGRMTGETSKIDKSSGNQRTRKLTYETDKAGNRTSMAWPISGSLSNTIDAAGRLTEVKRDGVSLITYGFDDLGRRTSSTSPAAVFGVARSTDWSFDPGNRLKTLKHTLPGQTVQYGFQYNAASQVLTSTVSNGAFVWAGTNSSLNAVADGLNRDAGIVSLYGAGCAASGKGYDCNGNLTSDGYNRTFAYDGENRLTAVNGAALQYDPLGRLVQLTVGGAVTQFLYDGVKLVAEYDGAGNLLRRYAPSYGVDEAIVWWEGADFSNPRTLHADRQGSVIASVAGSATTIYTYGPYGEPGDRWGAGSRFRYTGQMALPELKLYHYKARAYDPERGWFLQTDPVGSKDDLNLYAYVGGDPLNRTDPTGLYKCGDQPCPVEIDTAVSDIALAAANTKNSQERSSLQELVTFFGKSGEDNGVNFQVGGNYEGATATAETDANGNVTIRISEKFLKGAGNELLGLRASAAGVIGHEGRHGIDGRRNGGDPRTVEQARQTELNAYRNEIGILHGMAAAGHTSSNEGFPRPGASAEQIDAAVMSAAEKSVSIWCAQAGGKC